MRPDIRHPTDAALPEPHHRIVDRAAGAPGLPRTRVAKEAAGDLSHAFEAADLLARLRGRGASDAGYSVRMRADPAARRGASGYPGAGRSHGAERYRLLPGDQIEVHHVLDPDYSAVVAVAPDGKITVPGIKGEIEAQGLTLDRLTQQLGELYRSQNVLTHPFFSLTLRSSANQQVFVSGEVQRPGYLDLGGGERHVLQVIASAGGFLPTARTDEVIVVRETAPGKSEVFSVNLDAVINGTDLAQNVRIHPLDVVVVPRSDVALLDLWVDQHIRQALPVPGSASVSYTYTNAPTNAAVLVK